MPVGNGENCMIVNCAYSCRSGRRKGGTGSWNTMCVMINIVDGSKARISSLKYKC